ncbi:hypothetical protein BC781_102188 [Sediminitomix flava]|uniref:Uncharacterized protein n=2 Tax=Sediminitomix flava TaxID=379075 RepID=A0A315ZD64_SEDFL|nr:hypothetical protein BC781_102188 [Sediminitomix flava]
MWWKNLIDKTKNIFQSEEEDVVVWEEGLNAENVAERFELIKQSYLSAYDHYNKDIFKSHIKIAPELVKGNYAVEGHNPVEAENSYFGHISIRVYDHNLVDATWKIGFSEQGQYGSGFMTDEYIAMNFSSSPIAESADGFVIFKMKDRETLEGLWLESGCFLPGYEICKLKNRLED